MSSFEASLLIEPSVEVILLTAASAILSKFSVLVASIFLTLTVSL
jgi:hypothetical protein